MVTIVVCTRDRTESVLTTLRGLTALRYEPFEIVVIDNAPSSDMTRTAILTEFGADSRIRYVHEPRPGLSCARNRGIAEALGEIVAFTDDDVRVDPWWLHGIMRGFQETTDVACVTGMVPTAEINNSIQLYFDQRTSWGTRCDKQIFDLGAHRHESPLYPYYPGIYGVGANFAMTRSAFKEVGLFNEALGAGSPCGGGEDLEMFMRVILAGFRLVYEPSAIVFHVHRSDFSELSKQMTAYGSGLTAALVAILTVIPRAKYQIIPRIAAAVRHFLKIKKRVQHGPTLPSGLVKREIYGMLVGPWLYFKGRSTLRKLPG